MRVWVWGPQVSEQVGERGRGRRTGGERALTSGPNLKGKTTEAESRRRGGVCEDVKDRSAF